MKIVVVGTGYVGLVTGTCLAEKTSENIICVDIDVIKINNLKKGILPIYEKGLKELIIKNYNNGKLDFTTDYEKACKDADAIFIAVGTPQNSNGSANLDYIMMCAEQIANTLEKRTLIVIKSTVPVGTCNLIETYINNNLSNNIKIEVASNPEFISQGSAIKDTFEADRIVIGVNSNWAKDILMSIYNKFNLPIVCVSRESSELIKYASNCYLALKISYINEIANLCDKLNANIDEIVQGMKYDKRIGDKFLNAGVGYGGSCFPKDTNALYFIGMEKNYELQTIKAAIDVNKNQVLKLIDKAKNVINNFEGLNIAILGVTFKPETDDMRDAPSIPNIQFFIDNKANVNIYDPIGIENCMKVFDKSKINYKNSIEDAIKDTDICFIMTEWDQIINFDIKKYKYLMKKPIIFDGRNCYNLKDMKILGIEYYSIGR